MSHALVFERYGDGSANRGVSRFAITADAIHVQFQDDRVYVYSEMKPGREAMEAMKNLACKGRGLSTYISQHVRDRYASWYRLRPDPSS